MWGDNTNGLSSTGLLRPTDSSSAIRRNYNYKYYYVRAEVLAKEALKILPKLVFSRIMN